MEIKKYLSSQFCYKRKTLGINMLFRITLVIYLNYSFPLKCQSSIFSMKFLSWFCRWKFPSGSDIFIIIYFLFKKLGGGEWCGEERASLITRFVMKMCIQAFKATIDTFCSTPFKAFRHCRPHLPEGFDCFTRRACL